MQNLYKFFLVFQFHVFFLTHLCHFTLEPNSMYTIIPINYSIPFNVEPENHLYDYTYFCCCTLHMNYYGPKYIIMYVKIKLFPHNHSIVFNFGTEYQPIYGI